MVRLVPVALLVLTLGCTPDFSEHEACLAFQDRHIAAKTTHQGLLARHAAVNEKHSNFVDAFGERTEVPEEARRILDDHRAVLTAHASTLNQQETTVATQEQFLADVAAGKLASEEELLAAIAKLDAELTKMTTTRLKLDDDWAGIEKEHEQLEHLVIADRDEPEGVESAAKPEAFMPVEKKKRKGKRKGKRKRRR